MPTERQRNTEGIRCRFWLDIPLEMWYFIFVLDMSSIDMSGEDMSADGRNVTGAWTKLD